MSAVLLPAVKQKLSLPVPAAVPAPVLSVRVPVQVPAPAAALPAVASPVVEAVDMDLVDGDGKQQFTVEIRSLVDSICDKTGSVLSLFR